MTKNPILSILTDILDSGVARKDKRAMLLAKSISSSLIKLSAGELKNIYDKLNTVPEKARGEIFNGVMYALTKPVANFEAFIRLSVDKDEIDKVFWGMVVALEINKPEYSNIKKVIFPIETQFLTIATPENIRDFFNVYENMSTSSTGKKEKLTEKMDFNPYDPRAQKIVGKGLQGIYNILTGEITDDEINRRERESKKSFQTSYEMARQFATNMGIVPRWENLLREAHTKVKDIVFSNFFKNTSSLKNFDIHGVEYFAAVTTILFALVDIIRIDRESSYEAGFKKTIAILSQLTRTKFNIEWSSLKSLRPIVIQDAKFEVERSVSKDITSEQFNIAFVRGTEYGKVLFEPYKRTVPGVDTIINNMVNPIISNLNKEFERYVVTGGNKFGLTEDDISKFAESCYVAVSLTAINSRDTNKISECLKLMTDIFSQWKSLTSIGYLAQRGKDTYYLDSKKATAIYKLIYPQIADNIINAIPKDQLQNFSEFINDIKSGKLTEIYNFCEKYKGLLGEVGSDKFVKAEYVLNEIGSRDPATAARLIMQRIEASTYFSEHAEYPDYVEGLQKRKTVDDLHKEMSQPETSGDEDDTPPVPDKPQKQSPINNDVWRDPRTIHASGAYLFMLLQVINKVR